MVQLHRGFTESELLTLAKRIVNNHIQTNSVNAIVVDFYNPSSGAGSRFDTAITWAPNGNWGDANTVDTGDYSKHAYVVDWYTKFETPSDPQSDAKNRVIFKEIVAAEAVRERKRTPDILQMLTTPRSKSGQS